MIVVTSLSKTISCQVKIGDVLISVDSKRPHSVEEVEFILDGMRIGSTPILKVERAGVPLTISVTLVNYYGTVYVFIAFLVGTLFWLSGIFVLLRKRGDVASVVYHFGAVAVAGIIMMTWGSFAVEPRILGQIVRLGFSASYALLPVFFLHFSMVFPAKRKNIFSRLLIPIYSLAGLLSLLMGLSLFRATSLDSLPWFRSFLWCFDITRWLFVAYSIAAFANFIYSYRTAREELERRQLRWVILGLALSSLGFVTLWEVPQLLTSKGLIREEFIVLLSGATPVTFAVAIIKYHLLDIDYILNRSTVYLIVLTVLFSVYALIVGIAAGIVSEFTIRISIFISTVAAIIVALLFEPLRARVQMWVDRNFFRLKYDMHLVETQFLEDLKKCIGTEGVSDLLVKTCGDTIPVERIGFFVLETPGNRLRMMAHRNYDLLSVRTLKFESEKLRTALPVPVALEGKIEPGVEYEVADREVFTRWGMAVVFTVKSECGDILGFLVVGSKKSGTRFSVEDVGILRFLAEQSGYAYERILLQRRLIFEQEERERLEEISRMKTLFVSSVSHDLKTPLTSITMLTEIMKSTPGISSKRLHGYIDTIEGESNRLRRLIDNVLAVARDEHGKVVWNFSNVSLNAIVKKTIRSVQYEIHKEEHKLRLKISVKDDTILADPDGVEESLWNLISNAIQYSPRRKSIAVTTFARDDFLCASVKDNGIGIPAEDLPHLFDPFYRGEASSRLRPGGTGIGLSVVKSVMDAHEGKIEIKSAKDAGTEITLLFPMMEAT